MSGYKVLRVVRLLSKSDDLPAILANISYNTRRIKYKTVYGKMLQPLCGYRTVFRT